MSSKAPDGVIRPLLVFVLAASALKLLNMPTNLLGRAAAVVRAGRVRRLGRDRRGAAPEDAVGRDRARQEELGAPAALPRAGRGRRGVRGGILHRGSARSSRSSAQTRRRRAPRRSPPDVRPDRGCDRRVARGRQDPPGRARDGGPVRVVVTVVHVREHTKYEGSDVDLGPETPADELVEAALGRFRDAKIEARGEIRRVNPGNTPEQIVKVAAEVRRRPDRDGHARHDRVAVDAARRRGEQGRAARALPRPAGALTREVPPRYDARGAPSRSGVTNAFGLRRSTRTVIPQRRRADLRWGCARPRSRRRAGGATRGRASRARTLVRSRRPCRRRRW